MEWIQGKRERLVGKSRERYGRDKEVVEKQVDEWRRKLLAWRSESRACVQEPVRNFLERMEVLENTFGPILFQLPPHWHLNMRRLEEFIQILPNHPCAFEFRDPSWLDPRVYDLRARPRRAFCIYDLDGQLSPVETPGGFIYVRLHGPNGPYRGRYDTQTLAGWAGRLSGWAREGKDVFCYFDNDQAGYAVQNALELRQMLKEETHA